MSDPHLTDSQYKTFTDFLFQDGDLSFGGFLILYGVILLLCIVVYQLGFARKLPILKTVVIYVFLAIGAIPIAFLGIALPFVEALLIGVVLLALVRLRLYFKSRSEQNDA